MAEDEQKTISDFDGYKVGDIGTDAVTLSDAFEAVVRSEWLPQVYAGLMRGVRKLPPEYRKIALSEHGLACWHWGKLMLQLHEGFTWEDYKKAVEAYPSPVGPYEFEELGNDMCLFRYLNAKDDRGQAQCWCPGVRTGLIPDVRKAAGDDNPMPELCTECGTKFMIEAVEECTGRKVCRFDTIDTVQTTSDPAHENDQWIYHFRRFAHTEDNSEE